MSSEPTAPVTRVLVVDDDRLDRESVRRSLAGQGWAVDEMATAAQAIGAVRHGTYDCVLLDFNLPDQDAFSVLAAFEASGVDTPVIILTVMDDAATAVRLVNAGAADFLQKQVATGERLRQAVARAISLRRSERERRLAEARLASQQVLMGGVIDQMPSGLMIIDASGRVMVQNSRFLQMLGDDLTEPVTLKEFVAWTETDRPGAPDGRAAAARAIAEGNPAEAVDLRIKRHDQTTVLRLRCTNVHDAAGDLVARLALLDDVTDLRATEEFQRQLMAIASHDLRNPLAAIAMNASILARPGAITDERRQVTAGRILSSGKRMKRMIDDLFDYTLATLGKGIPVTYGHLDLATLCDDCVAEVRATYPERAIETTMDGNLTGSWDADRIHQVVQNLLLNSLKYGEPSLPIQLVCRESERHDAVVLCVHNQGPPIPPDALPHIFDAYRRVGEDGQRSLGLGLYIVRRIVDAHRGAVTAVSSAGEGTTITIWLPKVPMAQAQDATLLMPPKGLIRFP